ncbi:hypothetical protein PYW08_015169 [Mythimna loreyi]|uniref:Uncharacterized protein n=1 Tax=Mythimna loreyi TaxID=667449 RepID=A0ACC2QV62_9NEOP|nr:hypothetical protein PYW08_015169 [Mythimna loreyi]
MKLIRYSVATPINVCGRGANATATPKFWRKRSRTEKSDLTLSVSLSSSEENLRAAKVPTGKRGRGRAILSGSPIPARVTRGCFLKRLDASAAIEMSDSDRSVQVTRSDTEFPASLISTKAELNAAKREGRKAIATEEVEEMSRLARVRRSEAAAATGGLTAAALNRQVMDGVDVVMKVATKSGNLKGTFTRALKEAAESIQEAVQVLLDRTTSEEVKKLQEENNRLKSRMEELQKEVAALKVDFCRQQVSAEILRPPLAADKRKSKEATTWPSLEANNSSKTRRTASTGSQTLTEDAKKRTPRPKKPVDGAEKLAEGVKQPVDLSRGTPYTDLLPAAAASGSNAWTTVISRNKRRKISRKDRTASEPKGRAWNGQLSPKIRVPRSAAVVVTLQPEAEKRGITYKTILEQAKDKLKFADFGTPAGFRFKTAATGAKMYELSGATCNERADDLAAKLRDVLNPEEVRVYRPMKMAELPLLAIPLSKYPEVTGGLPLSSMA